MRDAECVPEDDVGVFNRGVGGGGDPSGETLRGGPGGLGDVPAGGVDFGVGVCGWWVVSCVFGENGWGYGWMMMD